MWCGALWRRCRLPRSGNLNFTFIVDGDKGVVSNFEFFTRPVIKALHSLGVQAEFSGRNDITIDGKKFSGNAQYWSKTVSSTTAQSYSTQISRLCKKL